MKTSPKIISIACVVLIIVIGVVFILSCNIDTRDDTLNVGDAAGTVKNDFIEGDPLDAIIYDGKVYCGLGMSMRLEELPEDFEEIGSFAGELDKEKELTSTMLFHENEIIYHYTDADGRDNFVAKMNRENVYIGIYFAEEYYDGMYVDWQPHTLKY